MRIPQFSISNARNIRLASCDAVPPVMIVTGPNGCGKSTLLQQLRDIPGGRRPMYIGPHRSSRRQEVRFRFLGPEISMRSVLEGSNLPGFEGIRHISSERTPWDHDDAASYLKYSLCQIELDRREAIADRYDNSKQIPKDSLPDVWKPLREMAQNLLPHLAFEKIDTTNRDQIRCLWKVHNLPTLIDIDDLSSGEKSVVQLFYPLLEHRIRGILQELKGHVVQSTESVCTLIDEPELHLHPNLQGKILDYIRTISVRESTQFILATHSPTMVEQANSEELFLLRPAELAPSENQLVRIATDDERLRLIKDVFGQVSNVTAMRSILVVEGKEEDAAARNATDSRIYGFLSDQFSRITIIAGGGKSECTRLRESLNKVLQQFSSDLHAYALLDRDIDDTDAGDADVRYLPVSMIENLLLDPLVVWEATTVVRHKIKLSTPAAVEAALDEILTDCESTEVARRVKGLIRPQTFRLHDPIEAAAKQVEEFASKLRLNFSSEIIENMRKASEEAVASIKQKQRRREFFHGKKILHEFYKRHMHDTGMSKEIFVYECARLASARKSVREFVSQLMQSIGLMAPPSLVQAASATTEPK